MGVFTKRLYKLLRTTKLYNVRGVATTKISLPVRVLYKNTNVEPLFHQKCITSSWQIRTIIEQAQVAEDKEENSFFTENSFAHRVLKSTHKYNIAKSPKLLPIISEDEAAKLIQENWNFMSSEKFEQNIDVIRMKDIERILYVMTIFNYDISHPFYKKCIKELNRPEREEEINNFGKAFICALHYMSMANLYPKNLIEKALAKDFILQAYGKDVHKINREALFLDRSVEVELPDYTGPRLEAGTWKSVAQKNRWTLKMKQNQMTNNADTLLLDVLKTCKEIFGFDSAVVVDQTLPHYTKPDIYICLDGNKKPIPVEPLLTELPFGSIKRAPEINLSNSQWIAIIVGGPNCYIRNTTQYCGLIASKLRQLRQIGYTPIMIPYFRWFDLPNEEAKKDFIQNFVLT
ncbi:uncharacterized protein LOC107272639 isoform X2 [Cephus cinctus]|uniref:Uncharacterized protein LOC107272639 isoform X2 n=1 Tax=Cephus cinctus TaxID=211228 RepID=A0AAJ7RS41_CEPCN|nr:uncharacterized protein LOC107272639 isoform X2 [Cephus cinctus]